jgi:hypothetical protein
MHLEIITYANKSVGMFEELVKNDFGVKITVLGWGTEWNGFGDKYKAMSKYLENKNDEDVVVFLDGFDTKINKDPQNIIEIFKDMNCKVLVSKHPTSIGSISRQLFGTCKNNSIANSGLYMGYVKYVKQFIDDALKMKCEDDQTNLNSLCHKYDFIKVDEDEKIFKNISLVNKDKKVDSLFVSYPGTLSMSRIKRSVFEYTQFLYLYICGMLIITLAVFPKYSKITLPFLLGVVIFYATLADKSCTLETVDTDR